MTSRRRAESCFLAGVVALVVATSLAVSFVVVVVVTTLRGSTLSASASSLLHSIGGALVAVLALWVGQRSGAHPSERREDDEREEQQDTEGDEERA